MICPRKYDNIWNSTTSLSYRIERPMANFDMNRTIELLWHHYQKEAFCTHHVYKYFNDAISNKCFEVEHHLELPKSLNNLDQSIEEPYTIVWSLQKYFADMEACKTGTANGIKFWFLLGILSWTRMTLYKSNSNTIETTI